MQKKASKTESFFDDELGGSDDDADVRIKAEDLIYNPESQQR